MSDLQHPLEDDCKWYRKREVVYCTTYGLFEGGGERERVGGGWWVQWHVLTGMHESLILKDEEDSYLHRTFVWVSFCLIAWCRDD